ncbi:MAG TPA: hypothetical protein DD738_11930, partial [Ruminiclostridium sp.]|nr:hypothetical protein [Ruminiclostridium sp.]
MDWWNELTQLQRFFAMAAIPATAIMLIQFLLLILGFSHDDGDLDFDGDTELQDAFDSDLDDLSDGSDGGLHESADALRLFSLRSIIAFLSVGGWMGVAAAGWNLSMPIVFLLAITAGWLALYFVA